MSDVFETHGHGQPDHPDQHSRRRSHHTRYISPRVRASAAAIYWSLALIILAGALTLWIRGGFTPLYATAMAVGGVGCLLGGFLALSGDTDLMYFTGMDEAQREANQWAQAHAFCAVAVGLLGLVIAYQLNPAWQAQAATHVGALLFLAVILYLGCYLVRRRH